MENKRNINDYLSNHGGNFIALSIFLLVTFTLKFNEGYLNDVLALLSAGISYFLMWEIIFKDQGNEKVTLSLFNSFLIFFILAFCVWVILNVIYPFNNVYDYLITILWIGFIFVVPFKISGTWVKIGLVMGALIILLLSIFSLWV